MTMRNFKIIIPAALGVSILFAACSKDEKTSTTTDNTTLAGLSVANVAAETSFSDAYNEVMVTTEENGLMNRGVTGTVAGKPGSPNGCATVTINPAEPAAFPKTVTIDYGTAGCTSASGITRKGKIIYTITGKFRTTGSVISVTFEGYSVNGFAIAGIYSITNNSTGNGLNISTQVTGGKITYPDGTYYNYGGAKTIVQSAGTATPAIADDEFTITGNNTLSSSDGKAVTGTIKTPLLKKNSCRNIVSGSVDIVYNGIKALLDYGSGDCDNTATITVANKTETITLP
jgi:hypothetical protein